jgi:dipeptidyl aminopeptidase/acylaminoacyl peptidase
MRYSLILLLLVAFEAHSVEERLANSGNVVLQNIPLTSEIRSESITMKSKFRSSWFCDWTYDGKAVVSTKFNNVYQLHLVDHAKGAREQLTFFDEPIVWAWANPANNLVVFKKDHGGNEKSQLFLLNLNTKETNLISDGINTHSTPIWNRDGTKLAYRKRTGEYEEIWITDTINILDASKHKMVFKGEKNNAVSVADFSSDGSKLLINDWYEITKSHIWVYDLKKDKGTHYFKNAIPSENEALFFNKNENGMYFISNQLGEFTQLLYYSFSTKKIKPISLPVDFDIYDAVINKRRNKITYLVNEGGYHTMHSYNIRNKKTKRLDKLPLGSTSNIRISHRSNVIGFGLSTPNKPMDVYEYDVDNNKIKRWIKSEVPGGKFEKLHTELIHYPTFDSVNGKNRLIPSFLYKPQVEGKLPVVIEVHGGPESQARTRFNFFKHVIATQAKVAVLSPNIRGSTGFGKSYMDLDNGLKRLDALKDIKALIDWVKTRDDLDSERIIITGASYGGYVSLMAATLYGDDLKGAISFVGMSNIVTFLNNTTDFRRPKRRVEYGDERLTEVREFLTKTAPLNNVDKINIPMLIVSGVNDPRVPHSESEQLVERLLTKSKPVWFMYAKNEGHGFRKEDNKIEYYKTVVAFIEKHI